MGYGLAALAGIGQGTNALLQGMDMADRQALAQQQLAEQKRQFDESRIVDFDALKAAGLDLGVSGKVPREIVPLLQANQERQRKMALTGQLATALEPGNATVKPGTTFETGGAPLAPTTPAPMASIATPEDKLAPLRRMLPILAQIDPSEAAKAAMSLAMPKVTPVPETTMGTLSSTGEYTPLPGALGPKPKIEIRPGAGDQFAVTLDPRTGAPIGKPTALGVGAPESKGVYTRADIENELKLRGLQPGTLAWQVAYNDKARQLMVPQGGAAFGAGSGFGGGSPAPGPAPAPTAAPPPINPNVPVDQQPIVKGALRDLNNKLTTQQKFPEAKAAPIEGPRPLIERPPSPTEASNFVHKTTLQSPPTGMTLSQIQNSGEYVQVPAATVPVIKQGAAVNGLLQQARQVIDKRDDLYPKSAGNVVRDNLNVGLAWTKFKAGAKTDPDVAKLNSLLIGLPALAKAFGDTGNIAVAERLMAESSVGFNAQTKEAALARLNTIEQLIKNNLSTYGVTLPNATTGGGQGEGDALSRQSPTYQKARARGLTDEQIQTKYGIRLVP